MIVATPHCAIQTIVTMRQQLVAKGGLLVRTDANFPMCARYPKVANSIDRSAHQSCTRYGCTLSTLFAPRGGETAFNIEENYVIGSRYALAAEGEN